MLKSLLHFPVNIRKPGETGKAATSLDALLAICERMKKTAPAEDSYCSECQNTGWVLGTPQKPERGVRRCTRKACKERIANEVKKHQQENAYFEGIDEIKKLGNK